MFPTRFSQSVSRAGHSLGNWLTYATCALLTVGLAGCSAEEKSQDPAPTAASSVRDQVFSYVWVASNVRQVAPSQNLNRPDYWLTLPTLPGGGHSIIRSWSSGNGITTYTALPNNEGAVDISVDFENNLWAVSNTGNIYRSSFSGYATGTWIQIQIPEPAADIDALSSAGGNASNLVCYLGRPAPNGVVTIYKMNNTTYQQPTPTFSSFAAVSFASGVTIDFIKRVHVLVSSTGGTGLDVIRFDDPWLNPNVSWIPEYQNVTGFAASLDGMVARLTNPKRTDAEGYPLQTSLGGGGMWESQNVFARQVAIAAQNKPWYVTNSGQLYRAQ